jgi:hypothetical protein
MSNSSTTLRALFAFPDSNAPAESPNQWQKFQDRLGGEIKTIKWPAAMPDLVSKIGELFNIELPSVLVGSWKKAGEIQQALEDSRKAPEAVTMLELAQHTVSSEHHPSIEIRVLGVPLPKKIEFTVRLLAKLKGIVLKIQDGAITEIQTGNCEFEGKVQYQALTIADKKVGPIELRGLSIQERQSAEKAS